MRIFKTKSFNKWAKGLLSDESLVAAIDEIVAGNFDAALGKKIYKQRVALPGKGKSGGARTILAFHEGNNVFLCTASRKMNEQILQIKKRKHCRKPLKCILHLVPGT